MVPDGTQQHVHEASVVSTDKDPATLLLRKVSKSFLKVCEVAQLGHSLWLKEVQENKAEMVFLGA